MSSEYERFAETGLPWHIVEQAINREIEWLKRVVEQAVVGKVPGCDDCRYTYRKIALLIVTGMVRAKEFIARDGHDLWDDLTQKHRVKSSARHGGDWHRNTMDVITEYFESQGFEVLPEPFLNEGRADLGVYRNGHADLFVEVGTTSAHKLWFNLQTMSNSKILLVPDERRAIEFTRRDEQGDILRGTQGGGPT